MQTPDHRSRSAERYIRGGSMQLTDARTAVPGEIWVPLGPREWWSVDLLIWVAFLLVGVLSDE